MKQYFILKSLNNSESICNQDSKWIPTDEMNPDYLEYVAWLFEGNTPKEWQPEQSESEN